ncbi:MAG TPA: nitrogenase component 1 [Armatimonadota bacterium]|nr:nitrogenase component 1 [Armatimonadota bacterium]
MSYLDSKIPPKREDRLGACISYGGTLCGMAQRRQNGCCRLQDGDRTFTQGSICLLLPALAMVNSLPDTAILLHGVIGCGSCAHSQNANVRSGGNVRFGRVQDALWLSTALDETDVINGGEVKLEKAIIEVDRRYRPAALVVVAGCVPGIIGDDIDGVAARIQPQVSARILPVHCEGFKTKIWATAYDAVYHALGRNLLDEPPEEQERHRRIIPDEDADALEESRRRRTVNLMNVSSMGRGDEKELTRLLNALGLDVNIFPVFTKPEEMYKATQAALSISTCPTHDDYFLQHLQEKYGIPYLLQHMPIGIRNTSAWLRTVAAHFGLAEQAEIIIAKEEAELRKALQPLLPIFDGKTVFVSAGEFRSLATSHLLTELGLKLVGVRAYHHDEFAEGEYQKLTEASQDDIPYNVANAQPFEEANLLRRLQPDLFLGHWHGNTTAAKLGSATHVIYNTGINYVGYIGVYDLARRLYRQLKNPALNKHFRDHLRLPYTDSWYANDAFAHIKEAPGE